MAGQYGQVKRMRERAARLLEKADQSEDSRMADKYRRWADNILASVQAIEHNWKAFGKRSRGNTNRTGTQHSAEARAKMRSIRKAFWKSKAGFEKMWRARRRRQYREARKCLLRFPRLPASVDKRWLKIYRKRYTKVIGVRPDVHCY